MRAYPYLFAALTALAACGSNTLPMIPEDMSVTNDMTVTVTDMTAGRPDLLRDLSRPIMDLFDPRDFSGVSCGNMTCSGSDVCCTVQVDGGFSSMCASSCPDGGILQMCDGPEDCMGNNKYCCADIDLVGTGIQDCMPRSVVSSCVATCKANFQLQCPMTSRLRQCHKSPDCADDPDGYTNCCDVRQGNAGATVCVNDLLKGFIEMAGGNCF